MGVDLTLYPMTWDRPEGTLWPRVQLPLDRRRDLWSEIKEKLNERPFGQAIVNLHDGDGEDVTETPYGTPLTFAPAGEIADLLTNWVESCERIGFSEGPETKGAIAYLRALPRDMRVVLWWH